MNEDDNSKDMAESWQRMKFLVTSFHKQVSTGLEISKMGTSQSKKMVR